MSEELMELSLGFGELRLLCYFRGLGRDGSGLVDNGGTHDHISQPKITACL